MSSHWHSLIHTVLYDKEWETQQGALQQLATVNGSEIGTHLLQYLNDKDRWVRSWATAALGRLHVIAATEALIAALRDRSKWVRQAAAYALGELRAYDAVPALVEALDARDDVTAHAAAAALGILQMATSWPGRRKLRYRWQHQGGIGPIGRQKLTKLTGRGLRHPNGQRQGPSHPLAVAQPRPATGE